MAGDDDSRSARAKAKANELLAYGQRHVDRVVSPPTRQKAYDRVHDFATDKPILFSFVAFQFTLSLAPILLFAGFAMTTIAFSLISAVIFSLFWIGVATLFLVPTLFITFSIALLLWAWAAATFFAGRWAYERLPLGFDGDGKIVANNSGKKIIFEKKDGDHTDFSIKAEAAEVKE
ncbi:uncharacterized protein F4807DRAFT_326949 [Annulohypoxylon truncatum]|uniref:uncharacterized protein n=1 Tax=Annulohypoxylon truncatum TaxID=327061 RepID=UPI00200810E5|nr:uncharacterized protein F4807DRAFT_326949 [Annulohypoxylon truncatum]KAI1204580.1 hypothetical protein F4807DRAFT_326949 [Annulohypoxylon truncatum]